jgi:ATP-dependent Clp protease ATP-binding subunit ClpC
MGTQPDGTLRARIRSGAILMFERYTEKARRVIFFARYEASQFGSPYIETEHLLLGLLRQDKALANRFLRSHASVESIRKQIEAHSTIREKIATSVDLPLSEESKRVLAYAAEEAESLGHKHIDVEHLLLALLREERGFAANLLHERGVELARTRKEIAENPPSPATQRPAEPEPPAGLFRDLTQAAIDGRIEPVVRRETETEALIEILCCRQRNCVLLVGARGVGKTAILEGLAQRIADGAVPEPLATKRLLVIDPSQVAGWVKGKVNLFEIAASGRADGEPSRSIFALDDLADVLAAAERAGSVNASKMLRYTLQRAGIQCIASCTPDEYRELAQNAAGLAECFRPIHARPLNEEAVLEVLRARKVSLEKFHEVTYADDALEAGVKAAAKDLSGAPLPGFALELLDLAGARIKVGRTTLPEDVVEVQKRIHFIVHRMDSAVANHEFEKARFYSDEEKKERENLRILRERYQLDDSAWMVGRKEIEETIARWSDYPFAP